MAWMFLLRSSGCTGTHQHFYPQPKFEDAFKAYKKEYKILYADLLNWKELPLKIAKDLAKAQNLNCYSWAYK